MVFSVYMPTDNIANLCDFTDCLSLVSAIINNEAVESAYMLGDFNAHPNEFFFNERVDVSLLGVNSDTYTFVSEANGSRRWLDHCVTTDSALLSVNNVYVKYDVLWSDNFPFFS